MRLAYRNQVTANAISRIWNKPLEKPEWYKVNALSDEDVEILIYDVIGWPFNDAGELVRAVSSMGDTKIKVRINSPGGDLVDAIAIYHSFKEHGNVTTIIESMAASAASLLALGGKDVQAYKSSTFMVHEPWGVTVGNRFAHEESFEILGQYSAKMVDIYSENSNLGKREVQELVKGNGKRDGTYMTATEAKEKGFIDTIIDSKATTKAEFYTPYVATERPDDLSEIANILNTTINILRN